MNAPVTKIQSNTPFLEGIPNSFVSKEWFRYLNNPVLYSYGGNTSNLEGKTWEAPGTIGSITPNTGRFTNLSAVMYTGPVTGNVIGNVSGSAGQLEGKTWEAPGTIGSTTPNSGVFTLLTSLGLVDLSGALAGQIKFPATQNASANANTLDDYQEGTFVPAFTNLTVVNGTGGATYSGTFTKVGRLVKWTAEIDVTGTCTTASAAGTTFINNLPYAAAVNDTLSAVSAALTSLGIGLVTVSSGYTPTWGATNSNIVISGSYIAAT